MSRRGISLVESLVAVAILAGSTAALMTYSRQETRGVGLTQERFLAGRFLAELREAFGNRPLHFYRNRAFPDTFDQFTPLQETLLVDHPLLHPPPGSSTSPVSEALEAWAGERRLQRAILLTEGTDPSGRTYGEVRFVVRYQSRGGQTRELSTTQIVY